MNSAFMPIFVYLSIAAAATAAFRLCARAVAFCFSIVNKMVTMQQRGEPKHPLFNMIIIKLFHHGSENGVYIQMRNANKYSTTGIL
jgi:hypothetical protein